MIVLSLGHPLSRRLKVQKRELYPSEWDIGIQEGDRRTFHESFRRPPMPGLLVAKDSVEFVPGGRTDSHRGEDLIAGGQVFGGLELARA